MVAWANASSSPSDAFGRSPVMAIGSGYATIAAALTKELMALPSAETGSDYWSDMAWMRNALASDAAAANPNAAIGGVVGLYNSSDAACTRAGYASCAAALGSILSQVASAFGTGTGAASGSGHAAGWGTGDTHIAQYAHQILTGSPLECLSDRHIGHGGDDSSVNVGGYDVTSADAYVMDHGPSYREVVDSSDPSGGSLFVHGPGQGGWLVDIGPSATGWYDSLLLAWADGGYLPMAGPGAANAKFTLSLRP